MKNENTKKKLLFILDWMKKTDEQHPLNATQIVAKLETEGIKAERKSISRDIICLKECGYEIVAHTNHNRGWYMIGQEFEDHEIKMLVDAVAFAKFLTIDDSRTLIKKIKGLATKEGERIIDATLILDPEIKLDDRNFNIKFDKIMRAISDHKQLRFQYQEITSANKKVLRRNGYVYQVTPYFIVLSGEEYFLICNPCTHDHVTHFRIEMISGLEIYDEPAKPMKEVIELSNIGNGRTIADYLRESVNMWDGEAINVTLRAANGLRLDVMRKFGRNIMIHDVGNEEFVAHVKVANSEGFFYWLAAYGPYITLEGPENIRERYVDFLKRSLQRYE